MMEQRSIAMDLWVVYAAESSKIISPIITNLDLTI